MKTLNFKSWALLAFAFGLMILSACSEDEPAPVFALAFETTAVGIDEDTDEVVVKVNFTTPINTASQIQVAVTEQNISYGTDYMTSPAVSNGILTVDVPAGATEASLTITKVASAIASDAKIDFELQSVTGIEDALITGNINLEVSFTAISSPGTQLVAEIGGAKQPNQVFVDLSLEKQHVALRESWDLGFYTGNMDRVIVNYSTYGMAVELDKIDLNSVSSADTAGMTNSVKIGTQGADIYIDAPDGDLTKTAIAEVSATASENKVYIINRGNKPGTEEIPLGSVGVGSEERGWMKIRVLKEGNSYKIQYAEIDATTFSEATIAKDANYNFTFFSFDNGVVSVEPAKTDWDFAFTVSSNIISFGPGAAGAYGFSDYIVTNGIGGTDVAEIVTEDGSGNPIQGVKSYDKFTLADVSAETFLTTKNSIGSSWRSVFTQSAYSYKYYVVKDSEDNYYKVQFLGLMNNAGERGHSSFKYELLK